MVNTVQLTQLSITQKTPLDTSAILVLDQAEVGSDTLNVDSIIP